jgi:hypothetical protein
MPHGAEPLQIERASREVIEQQLLTSLEDGSRCAIAATEDELKMLLGGLDAQIQQLPHGILKITHYRDDMYELGRQCFGWPGLPPA